MQHFSNDVVRSSCLKEKSRVDDEQRNYLFCPRMLLNLLKYSLLSVYFYVITTIHDWVIIIQVKSRMWMCHLHILGKICTIKEKADPVFKVSECHIALNIEVTS